MTNYRIVEIEFDNGDKKYRLEKSAPGGEWVSVYQHESLEEIRAAKLKRETQTTVKVKVIE